MLQLSIIIVILSLIIGFIGGGGNIQVLMQPFEAIIIIGTAIGSFLLSNPKNVLNDIADSINKIAKHSVRNKQDYIELLTFLINFFKKVRTMTKRELEQHLEHPEKSIIFKRYKKIIKNKQALTFLSDYMRLIAIGFEQSHELQQMMEDELYAKKLHGENIAACFYRLGESLPGLGIVAAVLGMINAMSSIASEPSILGGRIAAALIGTFLGVFLCYAFILPIAALLESYHADELKFLECIKAALVSHAKGHPPTISVECARQIIPESLKPGFIELEKIIKKNLVMR